MTPSVMSADGHLEIPVDSWRHRVPPKYHDDLPELVRDDNGRWSWQSIDTRLPAGTDIDEWVLADTLSMSGPYVHEDRSPRYGCGGPEQRLCEQDAAGIDAEILFPPAYAIALARPSRSRSPSASLAIASAYNSYVAEEFCSIAPDRLLGIGIIPEMGVDDARDEMERCAALGLAGVNLTRWPNGSEYYDAELDDAFFASAAERRIGLVSHRGFGSRTELFLEDPNPGRHGGRSRASVLSSSRGRSSFVVGQAITGGMLDRIPSLRMYFAETQAGWLGYYLRHIDEMFQRWYTYTDIRLKMLPSEYIREHFRFGFTCDKTGVMLRYDIGLPLLMWGWNSPHRLGTLPDTREAVFSLFEGVPASERQEILVNNVCQFFHVPAVRTTT